MSKSTSFRSAFLRAPLLRAVTPFIIGLVIGRLCRVPMPVAWCVAIAALAAWAMIAHRRTTYAQRWFAGAVLWPACCAFGLLWQRLHVSADNSDDLAHRSSTTDGGCFRIAEMISCNAHHARAWADAEAVHAPEGLHPASGRVCLTLALDSAQAAPRIGDRLVVAAAIDTIDRAAVPGGFDMTTWAASNKAWHQVTAWRGRWRVVEQASGWSSLFEGWRTAITDWLRGSELDERERGLVKAILIGVRDELDQDQRDAFARSGTMHVLAVSGSHVGLIYAAFVFGLSFLGKGRAARIARGSIAIVVLWTYAGLTGFTPSVLRATVTFTFFSIAEMTPWRTEPLNSLFGAAGILLLWDPDMLAQLSFQLSFLAVLGIALFYRPLMDLWAAPGRIAHYLWSLVAVSISAQVMTTPLSLLTFKAFPVWFLPANMLIVGLVSIGVFGGTALLLCHAVPVLGTAVTWGMEGLLLILDRTSTFFARLPGAYPSVRIDIAQCLGIYALTICLAAWLLQRWRWARWGTAACLLLLLAQWGWAAHQRNSQHLFVVHDGRASTICSMIDGRERVVRADTMNAAIAVELDHEARALGVERTSYLPLRGNEANAVPLITAAGEHVLLVDRWPRAKKAPEVVNRRTIVLLHPRLDARSRRAAEHWAQQAGLPVYDLRARGAYVR